MGYVTCSRCIEGLDGLCIQIKAVFRQRFVDLRYPLHFVFTKGQVRIAPRVDLDPISAQFLGHVAGAVCGTEHFCSSDGIAIVNRHQADTYADAKMFALPVEFIALDGRQQVVCKLNGLFCCAVFQ